MPIKLIGTEPYQVPRNSDLGTMAYQDATSVGVNAITATGSTINLITALSNDNSATITAQTTTSAGNVASLVLKSPVGNYGLYVADNSNALIVQDYLAGAQRLRVNNTGQMFLGSTTASTNVQFRIGKSLTGNATSYGMYYDGQVASDATTNGTYFTTSASTAAAVTNLIHYNAAQSTLGGTVTTQYGFVAQNSLKDATTNRHFYSEDASASLATGKTVVGFYSGQSIPANGASWNFYANGDAPNYFSGAVGIGTAAPSGVKLYVGAAVGTGTATSTPTVLSLDSTYGNNAVGKNLKLKIYTTTSGTTDAGLGISTGLLEITTISAGDIAFFKNASTPTELARITNGGSIIVGGTTGANGKFDAQGYTSASTGAEFAANRTSSATTVTNGPNIAFRDGTTNNANIIQMGSGNLQFFNYGDGSWKERLRINSNGNITIPGGDAGYLFSVGKADSTVYASTSATLYSPAGANGGNTAAVIDVINTSNTNGAGAFIQLRTNNSSGTANYAYIGNISTAGSVSPSIVFGHRTGSTAYTERMRINETGQVSVGTTGGGYKFNIYDATEAKLNIFGDAGGEGVLVQSYADTTTGAYMYFYKGRGSTSTPTAVNSGDYSMLLRSYAYDGGTSREITRISSTVDTYTGSDNVSGYLRFYTRPSGAGGALTTRAAITADGDFITYNNVTVGDTLSLNYLSTIAPLTDSVANWSYDSILTGQGNVSEITFKPDGTKLYVCASSTIKQYSLSTAWDLSTAVLDTTYTIPWDTATSGVYFNSDGSKLVTCGQTAVVSILPGVVANEDRAWYATLSTPWDLASTVTLVSTLRFAAGDAGLPAAETAPMGIDFNIDGTVMFMVGSTGDLVYQYTLTTPFDVSTGTFLQSFSIAAEELTATAIQFNSTGTRMYIAGTTGDDVNEYRLSTAWNVSTAVYYDRLYIGDREPGIAGIYVGTDYAFIGGSTTDAVQRYVTTSQGIKISAENSSTGKIDLYGDVTLKTGGLVVERPARLISTLEVTGSTTLGTTATGSLSSTTTTVTGAFTVTGTTTSTSIQSTQSTGTITIGGTAATGAITIGQSTGAQTLNLATGATTNATTKVVNIGTAGVSGSITNINIGSAVSGATGTITLNSNVVYTKLKATSAAAPTIASATTIAPTTQIVFVSGTTAIATITAPAPISSGGGQITIIPTGAFTTTTAGNIALATTAVVNKALIMTYDATTTKWYPSY